MPYLSLNHWPIQNSAQFRKNVELAWKRANSAAQLKIPHSAENLVPSYHICEYCYVGSMFCARIMLLANIINF